AMAHYVEAAPATVLAHGGRYLVRGSMVAALEGAWSDDRMVVVEFPTREAALAWYQSDEYRPLRELRQGAADAVILLADGVAEEPAGRPASDARRPADGDGAAHRPAG